jgi:hypothetical protein
VPAKLKPSIDTDDVDTYTESNADLATKSATHEKRKIVLLDAKSKQEVDKRVTLYNSGQ